MLDEIKAAFTRKCRHYGKPDGFTTVAWKTSNKVYHTSNTPPLTPFFPSDFLPFRERKYRLGVPLQGA